MSSLPAVTVVEALGSMPKLIRSSLGERALEKCLSSAGLPYYVSEQEGSYINEASLAMFLDHAARQAGDDLFGLSLFPHLSVEQYGVWGDYVLNAPTLRDALLRAVRILHLRADRDSLALQVGIHTGTESKIFI